MPYILDRLRTLVAADLMSRRVVQLEPETRLEDASQVFASQGLTSAPVVDAQGICIGMLSAADFIKPNRGGEIVDATSCDGTVRSLMTPGVQSVYPTTSLLHVATMMSAGHLHHLPVIENERVVGVVSALDVVSAMVNAVDEWDAAHRA